MAGFATTFVLPVSSIASAVKGAMVTAWSLTAPQVDSRTTVISDTGHVLLDSRDKAGSPDTFVERYLIGVPGIEARTGVSSTCAARFAVPLIIDVARRVSDKPAETHALNVLTRAGQLLDALHNLGQHWTGVDGMFGFDLDSALIGHEDAEEYWDKGWTSCRIRLTLYIDIETK